jgi:hypothetical protein
MRKIVSKKVRASARGEYCTLRIPGHCGRGNETVVFAHLNSSYKGVGNKSPDLFGVYACHGCHTLLDSGKVSYEDQLRAMQETQIKLYHKQLIQVK